MRPDPSNPTPSPGATSPAEKPPPSSTDTSQPPPTTPQRPRPSLSSLLGPRGPLFLIATTVVTLLLITPWISLIRGSIADALYSYTILIPVISAWLVWQSPATPSSPDSPSPPSSDPLRIPGFLLLAAAAGLAIFGMLARNSGTITSNTSWLTTQIGAWVLALWGLAALLFGRRWITRNLFATAFLAFTIPLPDAAVASIELGLQLASATACDWLFALSGTPYMRDGMAFWLPNVHIQVAPECSGIRSTLVLFITAVLGAQLLLRHPIHRLAIVLAIIPLGIFRNALRILTLTLLSVHVNPEIMHSALHRRGGPLFFAVSLIPLFAMFWWFGRRERRTRRTP